MSSIFISYSHAAENRDGSPRWKHRLIEHLQVFTSQGLIEAWDDEKIPGGWRWEREIELAIQHARLAVILLTREALDSEFILERELVPLNRRETDGLIVIPILCEPCAWKAHSWLQKVQIRPFEAKPLSALSGAECDTVLRRVATEIATELSRIALATVGSETREASIRLYLDRFPLITPGSQPNRLIGREQELVLLDLAFAQPRTAILSLVAWGGVGKTMLVQHWLRRLQREDWLCARRVYAWSFYSQGTKEDRQASEDLFIAHALEWFGVQCEPTLSPWDKGRLLADVVAAEPSLLILDGIEPLQYPPGPMGGQLRAPGVQSLLKHLARKANATEHTGLCLVTTREPLTDLADFQRRPGTVWGSVLRVDLGNLTNEAGAALLHHAGAKRAGAAEIKPDDAELLAASRAVDGHALTLNLLGRYLARADSGDIRRRDLVKFEEADRREQGGTTFKMLAAFECWFSNEGDIEARSLAILRLLGLFDHPSDADCMAALRNPPAISGLTEPLFTLKRESPTCQTTEQPLSDKAWSDAIHFLSDFGLIAIQTGEEQHGPLLDCHPLVREHFAEKLRAEAPESWRCAHRRLYEHLKSTTEDKPEPSLQDILPLYDAVAHACSSGLHEEARYTIYFNRILRGREHYSWHQLGAFGAELSAQASFFSRPWSEPSSALPDFAKAWLLSETACCLRAVGRSIEAFQPMRSAFAAYVALGDWANAASAATNLGELEAALGQLTAAVDHLRQAVDLVDRNGHSFPNSQIAEVLQIACRAGLAYSLHQTGQEDGAWDYFREAEALQTAFQPSYPFLRLWKGFVFCDVILGQTERAGWKCCLSANTLDCADEHFHSGVSLDSRTAAQLLSAVEEVEERAANALHISTQLKNVVAIGLDHLSLGRTYLFMAIHSASSSSRAYYLRVAREELDSALAHLRRGGTADYIPLAFLSRAWASSLARDFIGAREDLDDAWDIGERGSMRLHLADIHLHRARLFHAVKPYPWDQDKQGRPRGPKDELIDARALIESCGYWRRKEELEDAEEAARRWA